MEDKGEGLAKGKGKGKGKGKEQGQEEKAKEQGKEDVKGTLMGKVVRIVSEAAGAGRYGCQGEVVKHSLQVVSV